MVKPKALFVEGGDSVGKNDLIRGIIKYLLLANPKKKIFFMNFPQYWFFGHDVRLVLRGATDDILEENTGVEHAYLRAALYAIDRNIAMLLLEPLLEKLPDSLVISDRGPYSSCVTAGYLWANGHIDAENVKNDIVSKLFEDADAGMLGYFDHISLLCNIEGGIENSGLTQRKALDNFESEKPQVYAYKVYNMLGLPEIITKTLKGWRNRFLLVQEAIERLKMNEYVVQPVLEQQFANESFLLEAQKSGQLILVGPEMFLRHFGYWSKIDSRTKSLIEKWNQFSLLPLENYKKDRKEILDELETKIALSLKRYTSEFSYITSIRSPYAVRAINLLIEKHPVIKSLLKRTSGKKMLTFIEGLAAPEQLKMKI